MLVKLLHKMYELIYNENCSKESIKCANYFAFDFVCLFSIYEIYDDIEYIFERIKLEMSIL